MKSEELMNSIKTFSVALAALALSGGVASAAVATTDLNMRAGPGTDHQVVGTIPAGAKVDALDCNSGWCRVNYAGRVGYASASYLDGMRGAMAPGGYAAAPVYGYSDGPAYRYSDGYGYGNSYAPSGSYAYGGAYASRDGYASTDSYAYGDGYYDRGPSVGFGFSFGDRGWDNDRWGW